MPSVKTNKSLCLSVFEGQPKKREASFNPIVIVSAGKNNPARD
jgi:hypothetical protein